MDSLQMNFFNEQAHCGGGLGLFLIGIHVDLISCVLSVIVGTELGNLKQ